VTYELLKLPVPLEDVWYHRLSKAEAKLYLAWVEGIEGPRVDIAWRCFYDAGLLVERGADRLVALTEFLVFWYPHLMEPYKGTHWVLSQTLGGPVRGRQPSDLADSIEASLAHDIGFIVASEIRRVRHDAAWEIMEQRVGPEVSRWLVFPNRDGEELVQDGRALLVRTLAAEGDIHRLSWSGQDSEGMLRVLRRQAERLSSSFEPSTSPEPEQSALVWSSRFEVRKLPVPDTPPAPRSLVEAVEAFRRAGFFASSTGQSSEELARAFQLTWHSVDKEELPLEPPMLLDEALLDLDYERTYGEDIEADVARGEKVYETTVMGLAKVSGGALEVLAVHEDWSSEEGHVTVIIDLAEGSHQIRLHNFGDWVDPAIITGVNALLPEDGPRFWFFDNGGQYALVVRATRAERQELAESRGTQLLEEPPSWWSSLLAEEG
jgi:hypothetical protein